MNMRLVISTEEKDVELTGVVYVFNNSTFLRIKGFVDSIMFPNINSDCTENKHTFYAEENHNSFCPDCGKRIS
jgi:hypothetical protein